MNRRTVVASVIDTADELVESGHADVASRLTDLARRIAMLMPSDSERRNVVATIINYANELEDRNLATEAEALTVFAQNLADTPFEEDPAEPEIEPAAPQSMPTPGVDLDGDGDIDPLEASRYHMLDHANQLSQEHGGMLPEEHQSTYDMLMNYYRDTDLNGLDDDDVDVPEPQQQPVVPQTPKEESFLHSLVDSGIILR